jgi:hypothetical protein
MRLPTNTSQEEF